MQKIETGNTVPQKKLPRWNWFDVRLTLDRVQHLISQSTRISRRNELSTSINTSSTRPIILVFVIEIMLAYYAIKIAYKFVDTFYYVYHRRYYEKKIWHWFEETEQH